MSAIERNKRKNFIGTVRSRSGDKSVKVVISYKILHPRYGKVINRKTVVHAHDENNESKPGDKVLIMETRPLSKLKRWRIVNVIESAPVLPGSPEDLAQSKSEPAES